MTIVPRVPFLLLYLPIILWQCLFDASQISVDASQSADNPNNPFAAIEPSATLSWTPCNISATIPSPAEVELNTTTSFECARFLVPYEYDDATNSSMGDQFSIAMVRLPATDRENYQGPLIFNFGGPGSAGTQLLPQFVPTLREGFYAEAFSGYDLVSFDPRGVGNTMPAISCFPTEEDSIAYSLDLQNFPIGESKESFIIKDAYNRLLNEGCDDNAANALSYTGLVFVAEDLKRMAEAYGFSDKLSYFGISYGALLGTTYAEAFPDHIERMIIDGIVNPTNFYSEIATPEAFADSDAVLELFFRTCFEAGQSRCPFWFDKVEAISEAYSQVKARLQQFPLIASDDENTKRIIEWTDLRDSTVLALVSPVDGFSRLAQDLAAIYNYEGNTLNVSIRDPPPPSNPSLFLVDPDTHKPNGIEIPTLLTCVDGPEWTLGEDLSLDEWREYLLGEEVTQFSQFATYLTEFLTGRCGRINIDVAKRFDGVFSEDSPIDTSAPILIVNNRLDPTTPLNAAITASNIFSNSALLINEDAGHVAFAVPSPNECLARTMADYLASGELPANGTICEPDVEAAADRYFPDLEG